MNKALRSSEMTIHFYTKKGKAMKAPMRASMRASKSRQICQKVEDQALIP